MNARLLKRRAVVWTIAAVVLAALAAMPFLWPAARAAATWQQAASPGPLSAAHASLANNCAACHTSNKGGRAASCIVCHADDASLLQRQPTAFHATVGSCAECHREHEGERPGLSRMDHGVLADLAVREAARAAKSDPAAAAHRDTLVARIDGHVGGAALPPGSAAVPPREAALNCASCHGKQDRHRGFFGASCVQCHGTTAWTIAEYRHPAPSSTSCAQCHLAPPSHYMEHFKMISMTTARQPDARVSECFKCHQTTAWNDIKGVGWYKHH